MDRMYLAEKGQGARVGNQPIQCNQESDLHHTCHNVEGTMSGLREALFARKAKAFRLHSNSYGAVQVATGNLTGAFYSGTKPWDCAAVSLIVQEAGGIVTDLNGKPQRYDQPINGAIFSNRILHQELVDLVQPFVS